MNFCVTMPDGTLQEIGGRAALACAIHLSDRLPAADDSEQRGIVRSIRELKHASDPAIRFDVELFTMPGYVPGWVPDP